MKKVLIHHFVQVSSKISPLRKTKNIITSKNDIYNKKYYKNTHEITKIVGIFVILLSNYYCFVKVHILKAKIRRKLGSLQKGNKQLYRYL